MYPDWEDQLLVIVVVLLHVLVLELHVEVPCTTIVLLDPPYVGTGPAGLAGGTYGGVLTTVTHEVEVEGCGLGIAGVGNGWGDEYGGMTIVVLGEGIEAGAWDSQL